MDVMQLRRQVMMNSSVQLVTTEPASIATFNTNMAAPLKSCVVNFLPVQGGIGDSSPTNVRPITGWTGVNVYHSGADITDYTTYPVTFSAEAGTVYGGYVDLVMGVLTAEWVCISMKSITWFNYSMNVIFYTGGRAFNSSGYCDYYHVVNSQPTTDETIGMPIKNNNDGRRIYFRKSGFSSVSEFRTWLQNLEYDPHICYKLSSPLTYQLTPQQITTLIGTNNVWSDANGNITVTYSIH